MNSESTQIEGISKAWKSVVDVRFQVTTRIKTGGNPLPQVLSLSAGH
jgi:hypothetical protein